MGTVFVLVFSCWGTVLAASCPHECHPSRTAAVADLRSHGNDANPVEHCHTTMVDGEAQQSQPAFGPEKIGVAERVGNDSAGAPRGRLRRSPRALHPLRRAL